MSLGPLIQPRLRYRNPLFILAKAGEPVVVRVTNLQLANYQPGSQWVVAGTDGARLGEGHLNNPSPYLTPDPAKVLTLRP